MAFVSRDRFHANSRRGACLAAAVEKFAVGWLVACLLGWQFNTLHRRVSSLEDLSIWESSINECAVLRVVVW